MNKWGSGEAVAEAALALVGTRFRPQGRGSDGLDCIGLAAAALRAGGCREAVPDDYALRGGDAARAAAWLDARLTRSDGAAAGAILLLNAGPGQLHLAVAVAGGLVHADAGLRRVVMRPGIAPWPLLGAWRLKGG